MHSKTLLFILIFLCAELLALLIFYLVRKKYDPNNTSWKNSLFKGILERFILFLGLVSQINTILIFFGALKLGTRLKEQQETKISNDYFLVGNLLSVTIAISNYLFFNHFYIG